MSLKHVASRLRTSTVNYEENFDLLKSQIKKSDINNSILKDAEMFDRIVSDTLGGTFLYKFKPVKNLIRTLFKGCENLETLKEGRIRDYLLESLIELKNNLNENEKVISELTSQVFDLEIRHKNLDGIYKMLKNKLE